MPDPVQNFEPARRHVGTGPDTDKDGLSDDFERNVFHSGPNQRDADGDGLSDWAEYWIDTNPNNADTDGDQWTDGEDLAFGDPLRANAGGAQRAKFLADARKRFDAEGSDRDKDSLVTTSRRSSAASPTIPTATTTVSAT
jgi:Bacterial TSP3 repeat